MNKDELECHIHEIDIMVSHDVDFLIRHSLGFNWHAFDGWPNNLASPTYFMKDRNVLD